MATETAGRQVPFPTLYRWQRETADLIVRYYKNEIARLMHQAEHWAANDKPLAVHHRVLKADSYFQIVCLFERFATWNENPFDKMRSELESPTEKPGTYPPSIELNRYREPEFVAAILAKPKRDELVAALKLAVTHIEHMAAWFGNRGLGYSFEGLGEDMPGILDALSKAEHTS